MESTIIYHQAEPEALQSVYQEFNNCDFVLNVGAGRSLVRNSIRVCGDLRITSDGVTRTTGQNYFDFRIGVHSFVDSLQVVFGGASNGGVKENIQNYARWAAMQSVASLNEDDYLNASNLVELRAPNQLCVERFADGEITSQTTAPQTIDFDFAMKPYCILNKMSGDHLPFEKSDEIRLTLNLARNISALMGSLAGNTSTYELRNLRVQYQSVETQMDPMATSIMMRSVYNVKSSIQSSSANVTAQVPAVCDAVSASFQRQDEENTNVFNNYALAQVPSISRVQFLFNSATNKYITYEIDDQNTMLEKYIESFKNTGHNQCYLDTFRTNGGFGIGLDFDGMVDLSRQQFSVQLSSQITNQYPYNIYLYFHSVVQA